MKKKKDLLSIIVIVLVALATILALFLVVLRLIIPVLHSNIGTRVVKRELRLGNKYLSEMEYDKAVTVFSKVIEIDGKNTEGYAGLADAYAGMGEWTPSVQNYDRAVITVTEVLPDEGATQEEVAVLLMQVQSQRRENTPDINYVMDVIGRRDDALENGLLVLHQKDAEGTELVEWLDLVGHPMYEPEEPELRELVATVRMDMSAGQGETSSENHKADTETLEGQKVEGTGSVTEDADTISAGSDSVGGTISDSWEEIIASGDDGSYIEKYRIGDTKVIDLGDEGLIEMELVAFDADELADGSGNAHMTWIAKDLLNTKHFMNEGSTNEGGWPASNMRTWLMDSVLPLFPQTVRSNIKEVKKYSYSQTDGGTIFSSDIIWIPSRREILKAENSYEEEGAEYQTAYLDDISKQKWQIGAAKPSWWWLRSASCYRDNPYGNVDEIYFAGIDDAGHWIISNAHFEGGVAIGFCF